MALLLREKKDNARRTNATKQFNTQKYANSNGRDEPNLLSGIPKQFYIYLDKLHNQKILRP